VRATAALLAGAVLGACAHNPEPGSDPAGAPAAEEAGIQDTSREMLELRGRVVNSGTDRFSVTTLVRSDSPPTTLAGPLVDELRTLAGADVAVRGLADSSRAMPTLDVRVYEVLAIDGRRPRVGVLIARGDELWLESSDTLRLIPALEALRERVGAKVWVVGRSDSTSGELRVESYGVIAARAHPAS
jgi:hypothetical protein